MNKLKEAATKYPELIQDLYAMTADELVEASDLLNRWQWHPKIERHKPEGWDGMTMADMHETDVMRTAVRLLDHMTSPWERSRYHFRVNLEKPASEHVMFWFDYEKYDAELRKKHGLE